MSKLTAYEIILDNGTSYITSMASGVNLEDARAYFMGKPQITENYETGEEKTA